MIRQRVNLRHAPWSAFARALTAIFLVAVIYGGVLNALLALKVGPTPIERISGYERADRWLSHLDRHAFTTEISLIAGFGGLLVFLFFVFLATQSLPRPYFTRTDLDLPGDRGTTIVRPRAIERIAEVAAEGNEHVIGVTGRLGHAELNVDVGLDVTVGAIEAMRDVRHRVAEALGRHDLAPMPVNVTLTGYEPTRRDPS